MAAATLRPLSCSSSALRAILGNASVTRPTRLRRAFQSVPLSRSSSIRDYAFAFDIDGVLVRSSAPLPGASRALKYLQSERVPFILLTNGGGKSEDERTAELQDKLDVELDSSMIVQSHTPFADMQNLHEKTVLVVGGDFDKCQRVARSYGFTSAVTPADIVHAHPDIWPFAKVFGAYYSGFARPLQRSIVPGSTGEEALRIDAVFVYNDPRDWGTDATIMLDALLSERGFLGTRSRKNGDVALPNSGYLQDGQPQLYYSNPDLWWAASYALPRLGQGGFAAAFRGLWKEVTGGAHLPETVIGKPHQLTYEFAERRLRARRASLAGGEEKAEADGAEGALRRVYMVGDNPESDICGANRYRSPYGSSWTSILVQTGVFQHGTQPSHVPHVIRADVWDAVRWAVEDARERREKQA